VRKTLRIVGPALVVALMANGLSACRSSEKAGIVLTVTTAANVDRTSIKALQVTVNGRTQSYEVGTASAWSLGIETSAGRKNIAVQGAADAPVTAEWRGEVNAVAGQVVYQDLELQAVGTAPVDDGGLPGSDGAMGDVPTGGGGSPGLDGPTVAGGSDGRSETGGTPGLGGVMGNGGFEGLGGAPGAGGVPGTGGVVVRTGGVPGTGGSTGGTLGAGGMTGSGGLTARGGAIAAGGRSGNGGTSVGGTTATGGSSGTGGTPATGGIIGTGGTPGTGGIIGAGGVTGTGGSSVCMPGTPLTGGKQYCSGTSKGNVGNGYSYLFWSDSSSPCMTVYGVDAAFKVTWSNVGDLLALVGRTFDQTKTHDQIGTFSSDFAFTKTGSSAGNTYIGIYGWSLNPTREFYIIEDWLGAHPAPGTKAGVITVDGASYDVYTKTVQTGETPAGTGPYVQYFSVRQTPRQCGHTSISEHFSQWAGLGLQLGKMYETMVLVEGMGDSGTVDFMTATMVVD
jgi:endo-1,4-beta-xylanase